MTAEPVFIILKRISNSSKPQSVCIQSDMSIWEISPFLLRGVCEPLCLSSDVDDLEQEREGRMEKRYKKWIYLKINM